LTVIPAGPVLEGATVVIECRVSNKDDLDIVRLVHQSTDGAIINHEMTTNGYLERSFSTTGRYKVITWNETIGLVQLQIKGEFQLDRLLPIPPAAVAAADTLYS